MATGSTAEAVEAELRDAIRFHIAGLEEDGLPVPPATSIANYVELTWGDGKGALQALKRGGTTSNSDRS